MKFPFLNSTRLTNNTRLADKVGASLMALGYTKIGETLYRDARFTVDIGAATRRELVHLAECLDRHPETGKPPATNRGTLSEAGQGSGPFSTS